MVPEKPIYLICAYGFRPDKPNQPPRSDPNSSLQVKVAGELYCSGMASQLVFACGNKGPAGVPISEIMAAELLDLFPKIPPKKVIVSTRAHSTRDELVKLREMTQEYNWNQIGVVCKPDHFKRVSKDARQLLAGLPFYVISTGLALDLAGAAIKYQAELNRLNSPSQPDKYQRLLNGVHSLPFGPQAIDLVNHLIPDRGSLIRFAREHNLL